MANKFINLENIVRDWAYAQYDKTATTNRQKKLMKKDKNERNRYLNVRIDWSQTRFSDRTNWSPLRSGENDTENSAIPADGVDSGSLSLHCS
jgi:hypothetical protein